MTTLRLLSTPQNPDGSHHIKAPGGHEFWHFHAEDQAQRIRIAAAFHDGFALHPTYMQRFNAYIRRPTTNVPPVPSGFPCIQINVFENGKTLTTATTYLAAGSFNDDDSGTIFLGPNRVRFEDRQIELSLSHPESAFSADLTFRSNAPRDPLPEIPLPGEIEDPPQNIWIPARPFCTVEGILRRGNRAIQFSGAGQHNHYYGTRPLLAAKQSCTRGCVLLPGSAQTFQIIGKNSIAIAATHSSLEITPDPIFSAQWHITSLSQPSYPLEMNFDDRLILRNPRPQKTTGPQFHILYDAYVEREQTTCWVEIDQN